MRSGVLNHLWQSTAFVAIVFLATWLLRRPFVLAMKGASAAEELDRAAAVIRRCGGTDARVHTLGEQWVAPPTTVIAVRRRP